LFDDAVTALEKAHDLDPELPGLWRELGKTYVSLRRSADARKALREALRREPGDIEASYFLGALLVQEGEAAGINHLEKTRQARPEFWGSYYYLGKFRSDAALLRKAAELKPDEPSVWYQLARVLKAEGRNEEARDATRRMTALRAKASEKAQEALVVK
jgi:cytochrome c-type biogenesis protein CcmH/NrfG